MLKLWPRLKLVARNWDKMMELAPHAEHLHEAFEERDHRPLSAQEQEMLENTLTFADVVARQVGVARAQINAVPLDAPFDTVWETFGRTRHSRLPVYGRTLDDIKGLVSLKDVMPFVYAKKDFQLEALLRRPTLVPETMPLPRVLQLMKKTKVPLALVTDEYGGVTGMVSLKDILEELVGEVGDEDDVSTPHVVALGDGRWKVKPTAPLDEVNAVLGTALAGDEDTETLGGLVLRLAKEIPNKGARVALERGWSAVVSASDGRRITGLEVVREA